MKHVGNVTVISAEKGVSNRTGNPYYRCVGMSDDNQPTVFFAPANEEIKEGMQFKQLLAYDRSLNAIIRYERSK